MLAALGVPLDVDVARCLYAGLVTDTVGFRTAGQAAHRLAAELVAAGVEPTTLVRQLLDTHPFAWFAALARALDDCVLEPDAAGGLGLVHTAVPAADVDRFRPADIDSVVDTVRTAAEAEVALVLKQVGPSSGGRRRCGPRARSTCRGWPRGSAAAATGRRPGSPCDGTVGQVLSEVRSALAAHERPLAS